MVFLICYVYCLFLLTPQSNNQMFTESANQSQIHNNAVIHPTSNYNKAKLIKPFLKKRLIALGLEDLLRFGGFKFLSFSCCYWHGFFFLFGILSELFRYFDL